MINYWRPRSDRPIHASDLVGLTHLYQPLVGVSAISLYLTLCNQLTLSNSASEDLHSHSLLSCLLSFTANEVLEARHMLEGVGLLNTYKVKQENQTFYEYEIIPPLSAKKFFQSDVLSLALYRQLGKEKFVALREQLTPTRSSEAERVDVTKSFQEVFASIDPQEIAQYASVEQEDIWMIREGDEAHAEGKYPKWHEQDLSSIRLRLGTRIHESEWTESFLIELGEIRFLYQLDDWSLMKALQNPEVTQAGKVDLGRLRDFVREEYYLKYGQRPTIQKKSVKSKEVVPANPSPHNLTEEEQHFQQLEQISPIELLSFYQNGGKIPDSDVKLVESLVQEYALPHGVVNVLLEYVLYKNNYKLPKALVQKIAGHWKRLRIQTVQEALSQARTENWEMQKKLQQKTNIKAKPSRTKSTPRKQQMMPQAVVEQIEDSTTHTHEQSQEWMAKRARINEKLALWEKRKKRG